MKAKEVNEELVITDLIAVDKCVNMMLAYIKEFSGRQETIECLDLLC